jgi:hypothetical protein
MIINTTLHNFPKLNENSLHYLAGFLDGDGTITVQIKRRAKNLRFALLVSIVFHQKEDRGKWFFPAMKKNLNEYGKIYDKGNGKMEYVLSKPNEVKDILTLLFPCLHLKKRQAKLALYVLDKFPDVKTRAEFLSLCKKVDRFE